MLISDLIYTDYCVLILDVDYDTILSLNLNLFDVFFNKLANLQASLGLDYIYYCYDNQHAFNISNLISFKSFFGTILGNATSNYFALILTNYEEPEPIYRKVEKTTQNLGYQQIALLPLSIKTNEVIYYGSVDYKIIANRNLKPAVYMLEGKVQQTITETDASYLRLSYSAPFLPTRIQTQNASTSEKNDAVIKFADDQVSILDAAATSGIFVNLDAGLRYILIYSNTDSALINLAYSIATVSQSAAGLPTTVELRKGLNYIDLTKTVFLADPSIPLFPPPAAQGLFTSPLSLYDKTVTFVKRIPFGNVTPNTGGSKEIVGAFASTSTYFASEFTQHLIVVQNDSADDLTVSYFYADQASAASALTNSATNFDSFVATTHLTDTWMQSKVLYTTFPFFSNTKLVVKAGKKVYLLCDSFYTPFCRFNTPVTFAFNTKRFKYETVSSNVKLNVMSTSTLTVATLPAGEPQPTTFYRQPLFQKPFPKTGGPQVLYALTNYTSPATFSIDPIPYLFATDYDGNMIRGTDTTTVEDNWFWTHGITYNWVSSIDPSLHNVITTTSTKMTYVNAKCQQVPSGLVTNYVAQTWTLYMIATTGGSTLTTYNLSNNLFVTDPGFVRPALGNTQLGVKSGITRVQIESLTFQIHAGISRSSASATTSSIRSDLWPAINEFLLVPTSGFHKWFERKILTGASTDIAKNGYWRKFALIAVNSLYAVAQSPKCDVCQLNYTYTWKRIPNSANCKSWLDGFAQCKNCNTWFEDATTNVALNTKAKLDAFMKLVYDRVLNVIYGATATTGDVIVINNKSTWTGTANGTQGAQTKGNAKITPIVVVDGVSYFKAEPARFSQSKNPAVVMYQWNYLNTHDKYFYNHWMWRSPNGVCGDYFDVNEIIWMGPFAWLAEYIDEFFGAPQSVGFKATFDWRDMFFDETNEFNMIKAYAPNMALSLVNERITKGLVRVYTGFSTTFANTLIYRNGTTNHAVVRQYTTAAWGSNKVGFRLYEEKGTLFFNFCFNPAVTAAYAEFSQTLMRQAFVEHFEFSCVHSELFDLMLNGEIINLFNNVLPFYSLGEAIDVAALITILKLQYPFFFVNRFTLNEHFYLVIRAKNITNSAALYGIDPPFSFQTYCEMLVYHIKPYYSTVVGDAANFYQYGTIWQYNGVLNSNSNAIMPALGTLDQLVHLGTAFHDINLNPVTTVVNDKQFSWNNWANAWPATINTDLNWKSTAPYFEPIFLISQPGFQPSCNFSVNNYMGQGQQAALASIFNISCIINEIVSGGSTYTYPYNFTTSGWTLFHTSVFKAIDGYLRIERKNIPFTTSSFSLLGMIWTTPTNRVSEFGYKVDTLTQDAPYSLFISDPGKAVSSIFFAKDYLVGNSIKFGSTLQERIVNACWVINNKTRSTNFKSYKYLSAAKVGSLLVWDKRVAMNEDSCYLELGEKYALDPIVGELVGYEKENLVEAVVPHPATFTFENHFECNYYTRSMIVVPTSAILWTLVSTSGNYSRYAMDINLQLLNQLIDDKNFYIEVVYANEPKSLCYVFNDSRYLHTMPVISYINTPVNYVLFKNSNLNQCRRVYVVTTDINNISHLVFAIE